MTSLDINFARNILSSIMSSTLTGITASFMFPVDPVREKLIKYNDIIKEPICLNEMRGKMHNAEYQSIKEFVCDFRLMLFNCYRYFGCDSKMGKCAAKLEAMFEQKLLLLPIDVRMKTSMDAVLFDDTDNEVCLGRRRNGDRSYSTDIRMATPIKAMMDEMEKCGTISTMFSDNLDFKNDPMTYLTARLNKWQERRRNMLFLRGFDDWFLSKTTESDRRVLATSPEFVEFQQFISIGYFATGLDQLLTDTLNISHITFEDIEHAVLFPRTSRIMAAIVSLISIKSKYRLSAVKGPLPDYDQWNTLLAERLSLIYRTWARLVDTPHLFIKRFSIEPILFKVLGSRRSPLDKKKFHELSVFQRCHVLIAMCNMTLRIQESVHSAIDRSIEWEDHRRIVLATVGQFEYVRFSGLGILGSFYVYRMKVPPIDEELASYNTPEMPMSTTRMKRVILPNKYRMPKWHALEVRKSKKANKPRKRKSLVLNSELATDAVVTPTLEDKVPDDVTEDSNDHNDVTKVAASRSGPPSVATNDDENNGSPCSELDGEEDVPEMEGPVEGDMELLARDLAGVVRLIKEVQQAMPGSDDREGYAMLLENLEMVHLFFEQHESTRLEQATLGRLRLRDETVEATVEGERPLLLKESNKMDDDAEEQSETGDSSERYSESELRALTSTKRCTRPRSVKRPLYEEDSEEEVLPSKRPRMSVTREVTRSCSENRAPPTAKAPAEQPKVKRKVFQIYNDFFTDELVPVRVREDGSLESLPLESVSEERYALARKMIDLYKDKVGAPANGHRGVASIK